MTTERQYRRSWRYGGSDASSICQYQKVLAQYGATMENIVDETLFVTDMNTAFAAAVKCRQDIFSGTPVVASTIVQIQRFAFPELMIEIRCIAKV
jgi:2-iminobutanoate/2-iminopropanoate deaminase